MDETNQTPVPAPVLAPESAPSSAPDSTTTPQATETSLPPNMQEAFNKRVGAALAKQEVDLRAKLEQEYQERLTASVPPPSAPPAYVDDPAEIAAINDRLLDKFYENPLEAITEAQQIHHERQAKRQAADQAQWNHQLAALERKYPGDFRTLLPKMEELVKSQPDLAERPEHLERVYQLAKQVGTSAPPSIDALLGDEAFLAKAREVLREQIIQEYVSGKLQSAPPPMMGGSSTGGSPPAMPPSTPKSWEEAKRAAYNRLK